MTVTEILIVHKPFKGRVVSARTTQVQCSCLGTQADSQEVRPQEIMLGLKKYGYTSCPQGPPLR